MTASLNLLREPRSRPAGFPETPGCQRLVGMCAGTVLMLANRMIALSIRQSGRSQRKNRSKMLNRPPASQVVRSRYRRGWSADGTLRLLGLACGWGADAICPLIAIRGPASMAGGGHKDGGGLAFRGSPARALAGTRRRSSAVSPSRRPVRSWTSGWARSLLREHRRRHPAVPRKVTEESTVSFPWGELRHLAAPCSLQRATKCAAPRFP
jgi:hypothetical protein